MAAHTRAVCLWMPALVLLLSGCSAQVAVSPSPAPQQAATEASAATTGSLPLPLPTADLTMTGALIAAPAAPAPSGTFAATATAAILPASPAPAPSATAPATAFAPASRAPAPSAAAATTSLSPATGTPAPTGRAAAATVPPATGTPAPAVAAAATATTALTTGTPTLAPTSQPTAAVAAQAVTPQATQASGPSGAPVDVILSAEERQLQQAYRADVVETTSGSATTALTLTILYSSPGNVQIITPSGMEMIILEGAGTVWQLGLDGTWSQLPRDEAQNVISSLPLLSSTQVSQLKQQIIVAQTTFAGLTTVNGVPAWAYDYATTAAASSASGPSEIWIGVANGLPLKAQSTSSASSGTGQATTVITYQYDSSIKVQAPG